MDFNEEIFRKEAEKEIIKCRPGDWSHSVRVVNWIKKLAKGRKDLYLLISAAYIHDIGWKGILNKKKITFNILKKFEEQANKNSKIFGEKFLSKFNYSKKEIKTIIRLIDAADKHESQRKDEAIIVDADNLSKLLIEHLKEKYKQKDWLKMYNLWVKEFPRRIKIEKSKSFYPKMLENLRKQIKPG